MNERQLEIIVRRCPEVIFGPGFKLAAQQLSLPSGRIDLLLRDLVGTRHVVELKKGKASNAAIEQVLGYARDLALEAASAVVPWVLAHEVPPTVKATAQKANVRVMAVSTSRCDEICAEYKISASDLVGVRKASGVLTGGGAKKGLRNLVLNCEVFPFLPDPVGTLLSRLEISPHIDVVSGGMQTVIFYRCCKLGGYNRQHRGGHFYLASGVVFSAELERKLEDLGFRRQSKTQKSSTHEHIWWETASEHFVAFESALNLLVGVVDDALGSYSDRNI